ncbi:acyl-CoA N-acyltransferase [Phellopilus nigrolimitatus]|nr:acyl-CoA N-acyltransferase [Phellopilus nigrolimitatus]
MMTPAPAPALAAAQEPADADDVIQIPDCGAPGRAALVQQCFALRIAVFVHEQGFPLEAEIDDADETATHFLLRLAPPAHTPAGTVRATRPGAYYKLSRLAVLGAHRGRGRGAALVRALHAWAVQDALARARGDGAGDAAPHTVTIVAHAQLPARAFYARFGYEPEGPEFDEDGAPHQKMVVRLQTQQTEQ